MMVMKPEVKDRIISHEHPVIAAIYNRKFNQVVSACVGSVVTMWMIDTGQKVKQVGTHISKFVAELFNDYFSSIVSGSDKTTQTDNPSSPTDSNLSEFILSPDDVLAALLSLDTNKATRPDEIPPRILKECAHQIAPSLCLLFNKSLRHGSLPEEWKLANIIPPIHKKGDISNVENYRPISLLCVTSKVLERCVLRNLRDYLMSLMNSAQHGFIPGRSCTTQLVEVLHYIGSILDSGKQTDIIFMDMSKAFDKVSHTALINKLQQYNIGGPLLQWFTSYLHDCQQRVTTLGATSSKKTVCSGVPQGSILGPILFLLYVNDLPDAVTNSTVACFADDTKIFRRIDSITDAMLLQDDINNLQSWSMSSGLVFNKGKCKSISVTYSTNPSSI
ncbi:RNA-directed DNA polymerase from mobile element jockey [Paramuricea clavata]|uniref:RNA-directed DNA polymerase from mobile element jockey n=1 Tax=Paramuricea clavata TaxID=317549 RepID=A0A6S7HPU1_PARCT|nr:RNA-directed DNA polymerase from mobile element jockey [Paramuricea clavata]